MQSKSRAPARTGIASFRRHRRSHQGSQMASPSLAERQNSLVFKFLITPHSSLTCRNPFVVSGPIFSRALSFVLCPLPFHHRHVARCHGLRARAQREACGATTTCLRRAQAAHTATTGSKAPPFRRCPKSPAVVPAEVVVDAVALMPAEGLPRTERRTSAGLRPPSTSSCSGATTLRIRSSIAGSM